MNIKDNLKRGTTEMVLLSLLEQEDKYGYQLSQDLIKWSGGEYQLNEATMYPTLYRLTKNGYLEERRVQVVGKRFRVYYHLTDAGQNYLDEILREYGVLRDAIDRVLNYRQNQKESSQKGGE